jgi:four helix bundle suffix protein
MVQAARSGVQNIAEGSQGSSTSKKFELKLTNVARASLEELRLDYEDFLQRGLPLWERDDLRRAELVARRPATADAVAIWARGVFMRENEGSGQSGPVGLVGQSRRVGQKSTKSNSSTLSTQSTQLQPPTYPELAANGALVLINVACSLLDRQIASLAKAFEEEGGFTERLYKVRSAARKRQ